MQTVIFLGLTVIGIFLLLLFVGLIMPKVRIEKRDTYYKSSPEKVYNTVINNNDFSYRSDLKDLIIVERNKDYEVWDEISKNGVVIRFKTMKKTPPSRYEIKMESKWFSGYWIGEFKELKNGGTHYISTEKVVINNALFRVLFYIFFDIKKFMKTYQEDLRRKLKEP